MTEKNYKVVLEIELSADNPIEAAETFVSWLLEDASRLMYYVQDEETSEVFIVDLDKDEDERVSLVETYKPLIQSVIPERELINQAAATYLCDQEEGDLYDAYQKLGAASDAGKGGDPACNYVTVWQPLVYKSVDEILSLIEDTADNF
jgi:hypothetical protein